MNKKILAILMLLLITVGLSAEETYGTFLGNKLGSYIDPSKPNAYKGLYAGILKRRPLGYYTDMNSFLPRKVTKYCPDSNTMKTYNANIIEGYAKVTSKKFYNHILGILRKKYQLKKDTILYKSKLSTIDFYTEIQTDLEYKIISKIQYTKRYLSIKIHKNNLYKNSLITWFTTKNTGVYIRIAYISKSSIIDSTNSIGEIHIIKIDYFSPLVVDYMKQCVDNYKTYVSNKKKRRENLINQKDNF